MAVYLLGLALLMGGGGMTVARAASWTLPPLKIPPSESDQPLPPWTELQDTEPPAAEAAPPPEEPQTEVAPPEDEASASPASSDFPALYEDVSGRFGAADDSRLANPDSLEAASAEMTPDGIVQAMGGTLHVTSLVEGEELLLSADYLEYNTQTGEAALSGNVILTAVSSGLSLKCTQLSYDPLMQRMEAEGLDLGVPLEALLGPQWELERPLEPQLSDHFYAPLPSAVYFRAQSAQLDFDPRQQQFVLSGLRLTHHPNPEPDLYVTVREARFGLDKQLRLKGLGLHVSGYKVLGWPQLSRRIPPEPGFYGFELPHITVNRDVGFAWKQGLNLDFGVARAHTLLDYSTEAGIKSFHYLYVEPAAGMELGVAAGERGETNIDRLNLARRDDYLALFKQDLKFDGGWVERLRLDAEYGKTAVHNEAVPQLDLPERQLKDTRFKADAVLRFPAVQLGPDLYLTSAALGRYVDYADADKHYQALGGEAGLIWRRNGYDNFVLYRAYELDGEAVFLFDQVREQEVDFGGSIRLDHGWRHVLQGVFDVKREDFDTLQVGALKAFKTYELGFYWDFARDNAGLEFGLLVD